jgi:hypothetical protein
MEVGLGPNEGCSAKGKKKEGIERINLVQQNGKLTSYCDSGVYMLRKNG